MPCVNIVSLVFSLADCTLEKQLSTQRALMALSHRPVFADKKVIICALCFHSVCCLFHAKSCCLLDHKESGVLLTI